MKTTEKSKSGIVSLFGNNFFYIWVKILMVMVKQIHGDMELDLWLESE